ncbi:MAG: DUF4303 domain-containing protein [Hellea sp.]
MSKLPDFEPLVAMAVSGVESILASIRQENPDTKFYAYVLTTYGGLEGFGFHANDKENYENMLIKAGTYDNPERAKKYNEFNYYKWYWGEWGENEYIGNQDPLNESYKWLMGTYETLNKAYPTDDNWFGEMKASTHDAMIEALKRLENKGVFGQGEDRGQCLVYAGVYDGGDGLTMKSLEALNSEDIVAKNWPNFNEGL